ncbi:MAG: alpha-(1-_3)-arabinofuranosyltransferase family protein [Acidimicrobiales bacterium]
MLTLGSHLGLLLPFAGLPWMLALVVRAVRTRSWLHPALFALVVVSVGATNATALFLVGLGPLLWVVFAVVVLREATVTQAVGVVLRIAVLTVGTSLWWIAGLYCQGAFGIDVLRYTETARTVAGASTAPELLRGIGYWFFYGDDKLGPWIEPSVPYTQNVALIAGTYGLAGVGLLSAGFVRWRYRGFFVALVVMGVVAGVGAHPWADPPLWGRGVKAFLLSDVGLAMRSLPRAVPLLSLGLSVLAGIGIAAMGAWVRRAARPLAAGTVALAVLCLPPLWTGNMVASNLERAEEIPAYWDEAARYLEGRGRGQGAWSTRVLEVPGADFASYRWGNTVDPITPGIMDRPVVARELIPYGTPLSADLVIALDRQMQEGVLDPAAIAPVARFMGVGDIDLRADLQYERYNLPVPGSSGPCSGPRPDSARHRGSAAPPPTSPIPPYPFRTSRSCRAARTWPTRPRWRPSRSRTPRP